MAGLEPAIFRSEVCCLIQLGHMVWNTVVKQCCQCVRLRKYVILFAIYKKVWRTIRPDFFGSAEFRANFYQRNKMLLVLHHFHTIGAKDQQFLNDIHDTLCVMCLVLHTRCHMSLVTCHVSQFLGFIFSLQIVGVSW